MPRKDTSTVKSDGAGERHNGFIVRISPSLFVKDTKHLHVNCNNNRLNCNYRENRQGTSLHMQLHAEDFVFISGHNFILCTTSVPVCITVHPPFASRSVYCADPSSSFPSVRFVCFNNFAEAKWMKPKESCHSNERNERLMTDPCICGLSLNPFQLQQIKYSAIMRLFGWH